MNTALDIVVNGEPIRPGGSVQVDSLRRAGLGKIPGWRRWLRRLPGGFGYWQAADPRVNCFDGGVEIYACRHDYLDHDRRWGTDCLVRLQGDRIVDLEFRIIEGVYAAGNLFDRFVDAGSGVLGEPDERDGGFAKWRHDDFHVEAELADDTRNARFRVAAKVI